MDAPAHRCSRLRGADVRRMLDSGWRTDGASDWDGCRGRPGSPASVSPVTTTAVLAGETALQYTPNHNVDGNRSVAGRGRLNAAEPVDIPLGGATSA